MSHGLSVLDLGSMPVPFFKLARPGAGREQPHHHAPMLQTAGMVQKKENGPGCRTILLGAPDAIMPGA